MYVVRNISHVCHCYHFMYLIMPEVIMSDKNRSMERNKHRRHQINVTHPDVLNTQKNQQVPVTHSMLCLTGTCWFLYMWNNRKSNDKLLLVSDLYNDGYLLVLCSTHPITQGSYTRHFSLQPDRSRTEISLPAFCLFYLTT